VCFALRHAARAAFPAGAALLLTIVLVALPLAAAARTHLPPAAPVSPATGRAATPPAGTSSAMPRITVRAGRLYAGSVPFRAWGFNWGTGDHMPTLTYLDNPTAENYQTVAAELQTAKNMGADSMRVYVELSQVMSGPTTVRQSTLTALQNLLSLAASDGIYLDITGDLVWRVNLSPAWYEQMSDSARWEVQAQFWHAVAHAADASPAVLCYELTSEPVISDTGTRYSGQIGDWSFVQSMARGNGANDAALARTWTQTMAAAVRAEDDRPVTIGLSPTLAGAFAPGNIVPYLDLLTVHDYPQTGQAAAAVALVNAFAAYGKPVLLGETFLLMDDGPTQQQFLLGVTPLVAGVFEFFDGRDPRTMLVTSIPDAVLKVGLDQFMALRPAILAGQAPPAVAAAAPHFAVAAPASITAGSAFSFTVTARDQVNNVDTGYAGTVHFTSSDGQAVLPADATLSNGFGTFSATLKTAGNQTITATDTSHASITGTSLSVVSPAGATQFWVAAPGWMMAGWAFSFTVTAKDQFGNTATGYAGTVHFTSSDGQAVLPANSTLSNRAGTFSATLKTAGIQSITATDTSNASITGTGVVAVGPAAPTVSSVSPSAGPVAGENSVTIRGTNLAGASTVKLGTASAIFTVVSDTQLTATAPPDSAGTVDVTVTTLGGTSATSAADAYTYVAAPVNTAAPSISKTPAVGQPLSCSAGTWFRSPAYSYEWHRDGIAITGATDQTYVVRPADQGHTLTCEVTATNTGGRTSATSKGVLVPASRKAPKCRPSSTGEVTVTYSKHRASPTGGTLPVEVTCDQTAGVRLSAVLTDSIKLEGHKRPRVTRYELATIKATVTAHTSTTLKLKLPSAAVKDLLRGATETVAVTLTASNSNGTSHSTLTISPLKQPSKTKGR